MASARAAGLANDLLTLRPPPNVDFISGYPGLAPHLPDRPHATVSGTLEVRSPSPIKAKWLHIELRKVEHVPGSPPFIDTIGSKPTVLWEPVGSEYGLLHSQDFNFSIRIPESVPPTVILDNGKAGIHYQLLATLCGKGKKGILRRDSAPHYQKSCDILMLKHEMHPTWPVYSQPEERRAIKDNMMLVVERGRTCLGTGGDSIGMTATLYPDIPVSVRSFELALIQKIIYPGSTGTQTMKKGGVPAPPPHRSIIVSNQKRPLPVRIQPGMHQSCELNCILPPNYNAMSVSSARLIENTYEVQVSVVLESGSSITVGLPVVVSPFPIGYSMDLMPRMGMPPMALDHPSRAQWHQQQARPNSTAPSSAHQHDPSQQVDSRLSQPGHATGHPPPRQQRPYHITERVGGSASKVDNSLLGGPPSPVDSPKSAHALLSPTSGGSQYPMSVNAITRPISYTPNGPTTGDEFGQPTNAFVQPAATNTVASTTSGRFAVVNATQHDGLDTLHSSKIHDKYITAADEKRQLAQKMDDSEGYASVPPPGPPPPSTQPSNTPSNIQSPSDTAGVSTTPIPTASKPKQEWLSAEEEKKRLYEKAKAAADLTHRRLANTMAASTQSSPQVKRDSPNDGQFTEEFAKTQNYVSTTTPPAKSEATTPTPVKREDKKSSGWMPAEEEKLKLYEKAQAKALKTQAQARTNSISGSSTSNVGRSSSIMSTGSATGTVNPQNYTGSSTLKGSDLYRSSIATKSGASPTASQSPPPSKDPVTPPSISPPPVSPPAATTRSTTITPPPPPPPSNGGQWLSAEDEKARLRYLEAKRAVDRHIAQQDEEYGAGSSSSGAQFSNVVGSSAHSGLGSPAPSTQPSWSMPPSSPPPFIPPAVTANGTLSPAGYGSVPITPPMSMNPTPPPPTGDPPPFEPSFGYSHANDLPEKEKMRLAYAVQDASASSQGPPDYTAPPPGSPPAGNSTNESVNKVLTAAEEKARLRAQYAADDAVVAGSSSSIAASASASSSSYARPPPEPPMSADGSRKLTAAEEKALLKAQYAAERPISRTPPAPPPRVKSPPISPSPDTNRSPTTVPIASYLSPSSTGSDDYLRRDPSISQGKQKASDLLQSRIPGTTPPPPPPLAPRPPKEYIDQTRAEDAKIRRMTQDVTSISELDSNSASSTQIPPLQINANNHALNGDNFSLGLRPFSPLDLGLDTTSLSQTMYSSPQTSTSTPGSGAYP